MSNWIFRIRTTCIKGKINVIKIRVYINNSNMSTMNRVFWLIMYTLLQGVVPYSWYNRTCTMFVLHVFFFFQPLNLHNLVATFITENNCNISHNQLVVLLFQIQVRKDFIYIFKQVIYMNIVTVHTSFTATSSPLCTLIPESNQQRRQSKTKKE